MKKAETFFGNKVKDTISGFTGIAVAYDYWMTGCCRIAIQPQGLTEEGTVKKIQWIDIDTVEPVGKLKPSVLRKRGGPRPSNSERYDK